ncbi:MAG: P-II family nitrogen regulator [Lachnospiraceae bacterium]|nr:P-II family nitrogen regulator [Lachnospiraceae bacterium]
MGNILLMTTIIDRKITKNYINLFQKNDLHVVLTSLGLGTVTNEIMDYIGLESNEKAVLFSVLQQSHWERLKKQMEKVLQIDAPGGGISFVVPLSSIGGKKALEFLLETQNYEKQEESALKNTEHELIVVIAEQGYTGVVMDAARSAGAYGGTVIHAKGTGMEIAEKFMGISISSEKEIIFIVTQTHLKNTIMKSIMEHSGPATKAKAIAFSLPVSDTAGLRLIED